jgi:hypothetical protein
VVFGRGWGHGVGMSQWGAYGMALRGSGYTEILEHYYTGVEVREYEEPGPIAVGVDWARPSVTVAGAFKLVDGRGRVALDEALGTWSFTPSGAGVVAVTPPTGFGLPLTIGIVRSPREARVGEAIQFTFALSKPAQVRTVTSGPAGYRDASARVHDAGRRKIRWKAPTAPGRYEVVIEARAGPRVRRTPSMKVLVTAAEEVESGRGSDRAAEESRGSQLLVVAIAIGLLTVGALILASRIRR